MASYPCQALSPPTVYPSQIPLPRSPEISLIRLATLKIITVMEAGILTSMACLRAF